MRWVFIRPLNSSPYYDPEIQEPLGIEYLASILKNLGQNVLILDSALDNLDDIKLARRVVSFQPDVIGFSITTAMEIDSVITIYEKCSELLEYKGVKWLAGGNFVTTDTANAQGFLPDQFYIIKYEGETAVQVLLKKWETNFHDNDPPPGVIEGEVVGNLDLLPFPQRPYAGYLLNYGWAFNIQASRGCCSSCKYCASSGMRNSANRNWRGRSPENIVNEMLSLHNKFHAQTFNFVDEDFLGPPKDSLDRAWCFSREIEKHHLDITFGIQVRPNSLSEEIIRYLVKAGLKYVFMGIESDNPADFTRWGRIYCDKTWEWVGILQRENVEINAGTLLFHPESTFHGIRIFAEKLRQYRLFNFRTAINRLDAMPGSFFHNKYLSELQDIEQHIGIFHLPFANPGIDSFYQDINRVLAPIEAPSMHAICALPPVQTCRKLSANNESQYKQLKEIIDTCDTQVAKCFFLILEKYENLEHSEELLHSLLTENRAFSMSVVSRLINQGFVRSPEMLYRAINQDT